MTREVRTGTYKLYKGKYFIVFYDKTGERNLYSFDNVREILVFQNKQVNRQNINFVNVALYRALKSETHFTTLLTGDVMRVYVIDATDEEDEL